MIFVYDIQYLFVSALGVIGANSPRGPGLQQEPWGPHGPAVSSSAPTPAAVAQGLQQGALHVRGGAMRPNSQPGPRQMLQQAQMMPGGEPSDQLPSLFNISVLHRRLFNFINLFSIYHFSPVIFSPPSISLPLSFYLYFSLCKHTWVYMPLSLLCTSVFTKNSCKHFVCMFVQHKQTWIWAWWRGSSPSSRCHQTRRPLGPTACCPLTRGPSASRTGK